MRKRQFVESELSEQGKAALTIVRRSLHEIRNRGVKLTRRAFFRRSPKSGRICRACITGAVLIAHGTQAQGRRNIRYPVNKAAGLLTGDDNAHTRSLVYGMIAGWDGKYFPYSNFDATRPHTICYTDGFTIAKIIEREHAE